HEIWARKRIEEGWRYGPHRADDRKEHPCLVPYAQLSAVEKDYDLGITEGVLRTLLALGYRVEPPEQASHEPRDEAQALAGEGLGAIRGAKELRELLAVYRTPAEERVLWTRYFEIYRQLAERLLDFGEPLLAYDVVDEALQREPLKRDI